jgi:hypothetical protein
MMSELGTYTSIWHQSLAYRVRWMALRYGGFWPVRSQILVNCNSDSQALKFG